MIQKNGERVEIVHSLAKWKRMALYRYNIENHKGIYTDMNAIRRDEDTDFIHSYYVDQWDWEKIISKEDRNEEYLKEVVRNYSVLKLLKTILLKNILNLLRSYLKK